MRTRSISSAGVVVVGLLPTLVGGPAFALLMVGLCLLAYREYQGLVARLLAGGRLLGSGYLVLVAAAIAGLWSAGSLGLMAVVFLAVAAPLAICLVRHNPTPFVDWPPAAVGALYLGLPVFAAVALRDSRGEVDSAWLTSLAASVAAGWQPRPRGMAWTLIVILAIWFGDTAAYLVGRRWGRHPLLPRVSPKKTVEGSVAAIVASGLVGAVGVVGFGLGLSALAGAAIGIVLSLAGQIGDLSESLLKRQVGVKDSGALIPGHGGMLDRLDALLFALPVGWLIAGSIDAAWR